MFHNLKLLKNDKFFKSLVAQWHCTLIQSPLSPYFNYQTINKNKGKFNHLTILNNTPPQEWAQTSWSGDMVQTQNDLIINYPLSGNKKINLLRMGEYNNSTIILTIQVYHVTKNMLKWEITIELWKKYAKSLVAQWHWL